MSAVEQLPALLIPVLDIWVPATPDVAMMAQGSKDPAGGESANRRLVSKATGETTRKAGALTRWRKLVSGVAREAWGGLPPLDEPVAVRYEFVFPRGSAPQWQWWKPTKPDDDKLQRAVNDSLARPAKVPGPRMKEWVGAGVLFDDSRIVLPVAAKRYTRPGEAPGLAVQVYPLRDLERAGLYVDAPFIVVPIARSAA